ncbi:hypothetical protein BC829DRAFT_442370 [Chytridium lagenaria]|nr:hypothetical protein BC829DRAFT_442370 [Chytridium lagenaria]
MTTLAISFLAMAPTLINAATAIVCDDVPKVLPVIDCSPDDAIPPVCGSDGQTYINSCVFSKTSCVTGITKLYDGRCEAKDACPSRTCNDAEDSPVCGSDGKKYKNSCLFVKMLCSYPEFPVSITPVSASGKCREDSEPLPTTAVSYTSLDSSAIAYTKPNNLVESGSASTKSSAAMAALGAIVAGAGALLV